MSTWDQKVQDEFNRDSAATVRSRQEEDTWAQTTITITPEDDAMLREIKPTVTISASSDASLDISTENFAYRRPLVQKYLVLRYKLDEESTKNAQNQTYLQGVPIVDIAIQYQDESVQTLYMSMPCPPLKYYKDIMTSMHDRPIPTINTSRQVQTSITMDPTVTLSSAVDLLMGKSKKSQEQEQDEEEEEEDEMSMWYAGNVSEGGYSTEDSDSEMNAIEIINYLLRRAFWIVDPLAHEKLSSRTEAEVQTVLRYDQKGDLIVVDGETQTSLTCDPKDSNTMLLSDYQRTKSFVKELVDNCLVKGPYVRAVVHDIVEDIVGECANRIRYPMKNQDAQTLASLRVDEYKEEDVVRKLRLSFIVDPLESSIVAVSAMEDLLKEVLNVVSENEHNFIQNLVNTLIRKSTIVGDEVLKMKKQTQPKSIEQIFDQRRKKIAESMTRKATESTSTQTGIGGVHEVRKVEESKNKICSVCEKQSQCHWCLAAMEDRELLTSDTKILRTQDILLAYRPCYVLATASKQEVDDCADSPPLHKRKEVVKRSAPLRVRESVDDYCNKYSRETIDVVLKPKQKIKHRDSLSGWSHMVDTALAKPWSIRDSISSGSKTTTGSYKKRISNSSSKKSLKSQSSLASQAARALEILRNTFCARETCTVSSPNTLLKTEVPQQEDELHYSTSTYSKQTCPITSIYTSKISSSEERLCCTQQTYQTFLNICPLKSQHSCSNVSARGCWKSSSTN